MLLLWMDIIFFFSFWHFLIYHWYSQSSSGLFSSLLRGRSRDFSSTLLLHYKERSKKMHCIDLLVCFKLLSFFLCFVFFFGKFIQSFVKRVSQEATGIPISRCLPHVKPDWWYFSYLFMMINNHLAQGTKKDFYVDAVFGKIFFLRFLFQFFIWFSWFLCLKGFFFIAKITVVILI